MLRLIAVLIVLFGTALQPDIGRAAPAFEPSTSMEDCPEACHWWLIEDLARTVTVDVKIHASGRTRRVQYAADWMQGESCPRGRVEVARSIVGFRSAFVYPLLKQGFCPRVTVDGTPNDAPYLSSLKQDDLVFDAERSTMLTRAEYDRSVVPPLRKLMASQEAGRWETFSMFVRAAVPNADLLTSEIGSFLADPTPLTAGGDSDRNVLRLSEAVTSNRNVVDALLNDLDSRPALSARLGYRGLVDNLAGITSSVPTWGSPPVCANVDRIARHLPWGRDVQRDAKFLATLSRCETGSENLLRVSLKDYRAAVVATGLRVWWAAAATERVAAKSVAEDVVALVVTGDLPTAVAAPVYMSKQDGSWLIREGTAPEEVAVGLSTLGLLSGTIERLNSSGRPDQVRLLFDGLERGVKRLVR